MNLFNNNGNKQDVYLQHGYSAKFTQVGRCLDVLFLYDFNHCWSNIFRKRCYQRNNKPWRGHFLISYADRTLLYYDRFTHFLGCIWFRRLTYHLTPVIVQSNVGYPRYLIPLSVHWMVSNVMARTWVSDDKFSQTCYKLHPVVSLSVRLYVCNNAYVHFIFPPLHWRDKH